MNFNEFLASDFEQIQIIRDEANSVIAFIAIHDTRLGPAFGGIRHWNYRSPIEALEDAMRLARAMTLKCAIAEVPGGGGKTVLVADQAMERDEAYRLLGRHIEQMGGRYVTGPDMGTEAADLIVVAKETSYIAPCSDGGLSNPTSIGVLAGIGAVAQRLGHDNLRGLHVTVQGLGGVGLRVARLLAEAGARLTLADVRGDLAAKVAAELSADMVEPGEILSVPADIYAPCAVGGVIHDLSLKTLSVKAVAGSANNVLAAPRHGEDLFRAGILYAPDFVINSGGLIHGSLTHLDGESPPPERIRRIGEMVGSILDKAREEGLPPEQIAAQAALERLAVKPRGRYMP